MGFSKAHLFNPSDYHYALLNGVLSHPARIAVLRLLNENGPCEVKFLRRNMPISRASLSQHLKIMREMQILKCEQVTPTVLYWINKDLPNTYACVIDLLIRAGHQFDAMHVLEIPVVSRLKKATVERV